MLFSGELKVGLLVHHLDLALFPEHIGGEDTDGQHHNNEDAHKAAQHTAVTGQPGRQRSFTALK